jgi:hypothetical protein
MTTDGKRYAMVCKTCGSDDVSRDAWANWDISEQRWELGSVFDYAHCHKCECETRLVEVELGEAIG